MSDDKGPFAVSRRVVIGAASAAPVVNGAGGGALVDPAVARCAEWLALDAEIDRLGLRWSDLETILVRQKRWERMTPEERGELLPSEEMDAIDKLLSRCSSSGRRGWRLFPPSAPAICMASPPSWTWRFASWSTNRATATTSSRRRWKSCAPRAVQAAGRLFASASRAPSGNRLAVPICGSQDRNGRCSPWSAWRASAGRDGAGQGRLRRRSARRPQGVPLTRASPSGPCSTKRSRAPCLRTEVGDGYKLSGRPVRPDQVASSAHALEADTVLARDEKSVIAGVAPGLPLYLARVGIGGVRPPLLTARALGKHGAEDQFDLSEAQFEFIVRLAAKMTRKRIVLGHSPASLIDPDTSNPYTTSVSGHRP